MRKWKLPHWKSGTTLLFLSFLASFLLAELGARTLFTPEERSRGALALFRELRNTYTNVIEFEKCGFADSLTPHPYFGFVHHNVPPCGVRANNIGVLQNLNVPFERNPNFFSVFLLGGSVASHLSIPDKYFSQLEQELNKYHSPNGKPFQILSGAVGSWGVPIQLNVLSVYGHAVDAVIAVDGYNEAVRASYGQPITSPDSINFLYTARPQLLGSYHSLISLARMLQRTGANSFFGSSYLLLAVYRRVLGLFQSDAVRIARENALEKFFRFPDNTSQQARESWNRRKYENYIHLLAAQANAYGIPYAHFVQPFKDLGKPLTSEEKTYTSPVPPKLYSDVFLRASAQAHAKGLHSFSLANAFEKETGPIYSDGVHCRFEALGESRGYRILAALMAKKIALAWKLKPNSGSAPRLRDPRASQIKRASHDTPQKVSKELGSFVHPKDALSRRE